MLWGPVALVGSGRRDRLLDRLDAAGRHRLLDELDGLLVLGLLQTPAPHVSGTGAAVKHTH